MSQETRQAVIHALRFKVSEHFPSELIYGCLVAYVFFTRNVLDFKENALPAFLVLTIGYQISGLLIQIQKRRIPDLWDLMYWFFGTTIFAATYTLAMYGVIAIAVDVWHQINIGWTSLDPLANQIQFMVLTGLAIFIIGGLLFWFRLKQRFLYGLTEAFVGIFVGMHRVIVDPWSGAPVNAGFYLALLTAGIYLVVRGLDNIHKASQDNDKTLHNFSLFIRKTSSRMKPDLGPWSLSKKAHKE